MSVIGAILGLVFVGAVGYFIYQKVHVKAKAKAKEIEAVVRGRIDK